MSEYLQKLIQIIIVILVIVFTIFSVVQTRKQNDRNLLFALKKYANDMNGECPITVGTKGGLIIRKVAYNDPKSVIYEYKFLSYSIDDFDLESLKINLSKSINDELESMQSLSKLRNKDVVFEYHFFDSFNKELVNFRILFNTPITNLN